MRDRSGDIKTQQANVSSQTVSPKGSVTIHVGDTKLSIKTDRDAEYVEALTSLVTSKFETIQAAAGSIPKDKQLVMLSLTIAESLLDAQADNAQLRAALKERVDACIKVLDDVESELL